VHRVERGGRDEAHGERDFRRRDSDNFSAYKPAVKTGGRSKIYVFYRDADVYHRRVEIMEENIMADNLLRDMRRDINGDLRGGVSNNNANRYGVLLTIGVAR